MASEVLVWTGITPNPNTLKFNVNNVLVPQGSFEFDQKEKAINSKLATKLFENSFVKGVLFGFNFITVTKDDKSDWFEISDPIIDQIKAFLKTGTPIVDDLSQAVPTSGYGVPGSPIGPSEYDANDPVVKKILELLETEIKPAVAMDGGDVTLQGFKDGVVSLFLMGACRGCPSSSITLKMGIETRLKESIPEVKEVISI